ncbi:bifunctional alpha,alpha-trehalose-phosphate synthase (UDP-forming)/trehalose-phosphatase [Dyadobacter fanqingshengii]|uniref:Bifunctional alpha,alpha-trehalose-phosphate synthase (UDP-forming)/trehalose-phosphatase n=1 Tax=Dyadobacter fanqingshengii TaxID=2906443 RepID=A0A9X1TAI8_9BACT|nr:bifunctional alpha,alpha-trehalose-phosphate synthase (UDP-forming)/trehalose-phosphatase [Dyadobacter fanqingshengii]MCF0040954.1 bifunctional alpha,alpha-trehalose-phosphate synthase (UDP-forming)/trehalose-phosphatase [Dyadobacter fanqingshengii]USJ37314.1 bifunctional alpha,alpha-trehalose-phosphate synthase (UDP-forming)/trehalose-phosphatase [Dyadobacter fanqingshengii]
MENLKQQKNAGRLVIVAYRLPFKIVRENDQAQLFQNSGGLVSAVLSLVKNKNGPVFSSDDKIQWIGFSENTREELEGQSLTNEDFQAHPVFIPEDVNEKYYEGFCNNLIWPLCHYFPSLARFDDEYFEAYQIANRLFFDKIDEIIQPGDVIWVQDYQLMLLPEMIRQKYPDNKIGFFFHIPFPSFELFRLLPVKWRKAIVDGILGADVVGFHTNDYVEYFLKAARLVSGYGNKLHYINMSNRIVKVDSFPISVDFDKFNDAYDDPMVADARNDARHSLNQKIIFSVDRLDYSKGIIHRLRGFQRFLERYPEWHEKVSFVMVVVPSRDTIEQYQQMKSEIDQTVGRINADYGNIYWQPIIYQYRSMPYHELVGMYTVSDVALITPVRDGMNLVCKEYVASRKDRKGVLILSEMAGAAAELGEALIINPLDIQDIADAIKNAFEMPEEEQTKRMDAMRERIKDYDVFAWTEDFFTQMTMLEQEHERLRQVFLTNKGIDAIRHAYANATNRILFFDYDGTLAPIVPDPAKAIVSEDVKKLILEIAKRDTVIIISGRDRHFLDNLFRDLPVHIIAEHGALTRTKGSDVWVLNESYEENWKESIRPIMDIYAKRCPGAFVEEKETSLAWHYRTADEKEYAQRRAQELLWQLKNYIQPELNLQVIDGSKVVEVKKTAFNKGTASRAFVENGDYDFVLAIGDDTTDEDMFEALPDTAYTIKIGDDLSAARNHIRSQEEVFHFLNFMVSSIGE